MCKNSISETGRLSDSLMFTSLPEQRKQNPGSSSSEEILFGEATTVKTGTYLCYIVILQNCRIIYILPYTTYTRHPGFKMFFEEMIYELNAACK